MKTILCDRLGIDIPIIQAPMGGAVWPSLAAAVSNAGGLGMLVLWRADAATIRRQLRETRALTKRPFGVNLNLDFPQEERLAVCLEEKVPIISLFWGDPSALAPRAKSGGAIVLHTVASAEDARRAVDCGVDIIVAQGWEAGGHVRGTVATLPLVPAVVDAVSPTPVVAAGGIADGRGLAAVLALGASGAWIGTRFLASEEAAIHPRYRERLLKATENDTVFLEELFDVRWPKAPHRVLRNRTVADWEAAGRRRSHRDLAKRRSDRSLPIVYAGRGCRGRHRRACAVGGPKRRSGVQTSASGRHRAGDFAGGADHPRAAGVHMRCFGAPRVPGLRSDERLMSDAISSRSALIHQMMLAVFGFSFAIVQ